MKRIELWFTAILPVIDFIGVVLSIILARNLRTALDILPIDQNRYISNSFQFLWWYFPVVIFFFAYHRLYNLFETRKLYSTLIRIISATASTAMIFFVVVLVGRMTFINLHYKNWYEWSNAVSLLTVIYFWFSSIVIMTLLRWVYRFILNVLFVGGIGNKKTLIIGNTSVAQTIWETLVREPTLGFEPIGIIEANHHQCTDRNDDKKFRTHIVGEINNINEAINHFKPDQIIQADPDLPSGQVLEMIDLTNELRSSFMFAPNLFEVLATNVSTGNIGGIPLLELKRTPLDGWGKIFKRGIDIFVSSVMIIILSPLILLFMLLVKLQDGGPVFFTQERISAGRPFKIIKFRSMIMNAKISLQR